MVGAVGETASMKRRKLWKTGEDGLCCSSSAIQTRLDPSSLLEEGVKPLLFLLFLLCCRLPPELGETAKVYRLLSHSTCFQKFVFVSMGNNFAYLACGYACCAA